MARTASQERRDEKRILKLRKNTQRAERAYDNETSQLRSMKAANARLLEQGLPKRYTMRQFREQRAKADAALGRWKARRQKYERAVKSEAERDRTEDAPRNPRAYVRAYGGARITIATLNYLQRIRWGGSFNGPASGVRTYAEQARLYALYLSGRGNPAYPPTSPRANHMERNIRRDGFHAGDTNRAIPGYYERYSNEPWHREKR